MYNHSGYFTNLTGIFVVWDVSIPGTQGYGGYQYLDAASSFVPVSPGPGGTGNYYETGHSYPEIQSGQAFLVQAVGNGSIGQVSFNEDAKSSNSRIITRGVSSNQYKRLWAGLYSGMGICDGTSITFGKEYSNEISTGDAGKLQNPGENFMIWKTNGNALAIEKRGLINQYDTIFYSFDNLRQIAYQLKIHPQLLQEEGLHATLVDNYLGKKTSLSLTDTSSFEFIVDINKASFEKRFMIVFERDIISEPVAVDNMNGANNDLFIIYPNPAENKMLRVRFRSQAYGVYNLQLVNNSGQTLYNGMIKINGSNKTMSIKLGKNIPAGSYSLIVTDTDERKSIQQVFIR